MKSHGSHTINVINIHVAKRFIAQHHYAVTCPPHLLECLGLFDKGEPVGVALWGWGVQPKHTIKRLLPALEIKDYRELNRLCVLDACPRNTESHFISRCIKWFKANRPEIKALISWADGMRGKPGYVYQASNWQYIGKITTEFYINDKGNVIHPRRLITHYGRRDKAFVQTLGLKKVRGYQFLYIYWLCSTNLRMQLEASATYQHNLQYPKREDCFIWDAETGKAIEIGDVALRGIARFGPQTQGQTIMTF